MPTRKKRTSRRVEPTVLDMPITVGVCAMDKKARRGPSRRDWAGCPLGGKRQAHPARARAPPPAPAGRARAGPSCVGESCGVGRLGRVTLVGSGC